VLDERLEIDIPAGRSVVTAVSPTAPREQTDMKGNGLTTDEEKIRAIYEYVSQEIRYVSLSFGVTRYAPHPAGTVLANQYGDCKDKHTLLAAMLGAAGIEAWPVLANTGRSVGSRCPRRWSSTTSSPSCRAARGRRTGCGSTRRPASRHTGCSSRA